MHSKLRKLNLIWFQRKRRHSSINPLSWLSGEDLKAIYPLILIGSKSPRNYLDLLGISSATVYLVSPRLRFITSMNISVIIYSNANLWQTFKVWEECIFKTSLERGVDELARMLHTVQLSVSWCRIEDHRMFSIVVHALGT